MSASDMNNCASAPQLRAQDAVLFNEIAEYVSILAVQPPGEQGEQRREHRVLFTAGVYITDPDLMPFSLSIQRWDITARKGQP
jgi:hypothetical protein